MSPNTNIKLEGSPPACIAGAEIISVQDVQRILHSHLKQLENCAHLGFGHGEVRVYRGTGWLSPRSPERALFFLQKKPHVCNFSTRASGAPTGCANFMGA